jgi:predicted RecA/RadA family phage recombinase
MALQTNYPDNLAAAFAGMVANLEPSVLVSRLVETEAGIGFGVPVIQGTADDEINVVAASTDDPVGITVRVNDQVSNLYPKGASAMIMTQGVMWVTVTDAGGVAAGDPVWVAVATGTFSNADAGSSGSLRLAGCRWESSAANGALAKIRVNMDVPAVAGAA